MFYCVYLRLDFVDVGAVVFEGTLRYYAAAVEGVVHIVDGHAEDFDPVFECVADTVGALE